MSKMNTDAGMPIALTLEPAPTIVVPVENHKTCRSVTAIIRVERACRCSLKSRKRKRFICAVAVRAPISRFVTATVKPTCRCCSQDRPDLYKYKE